MANFEEKNTLVTRENCDLRVLGEPAPQFHLVTSDLFVWLPCEHCFA